MAVLIWDQEGKRLYETGVEKCVLYLRDTNGAYPTGVAWNGVTNITESPSGAEATPLYADNNKYLNLYSTEEMSLTIEAYTYPDEFSECDGSASIVTGVYAGQQRRKSFGLAYKTLLGNDVEGTDHGYKLHLAYGCTASPSEKGYSSVNDSPEAIGFNWSVTTTPVEVAGLKPTALLIIDSTKVASAKLKALEDVIYGTESGSARLPLPNEVKTLLQ